MGRKPKDQEWKPGDPWQNTFPLVTVRCPNCRAYVHIRSAMLGRFRAWVVRGRGFAKQGLPVPSANPADMSDSDPI